MTADMISAAEARMLATKGLSLGGVQFDRAMASVMARIRKAADNGLFFVSHPFYGHDPYPLSDLANAIRCALEQNGYKWVHHPEPPGNTDPREHAYDTVSWK